MKSFYLFALVVFIFFVSCEKKSSCGSSIVLTSTTLTPTIGDNVVIKAPFFSSNDVYQWNGPGVNRINQSTTLNLDDIKLSQSGTYSCSIGGNGDCNSLGDTIVINVQLKQETPSCTLTNNFASISSLEIPNNNFFSVTQGYDGTFEAVSLYGYGGFGMPNITVLFNKYNDHAEPRDGTHITAEGPGFSISQEPNEVSLSFVYASTYYHSKPGYKVYVSHVNGKLQISFCNVVFYASTKPLTNVSCKMTES